MNLRLFLPFGFIFVETVVVKQKKSDVVVAVDVPDSFTSIDRKFFRVMCSCWKRLTEKLNSVFAHSIQRRRGGRGGDGGGREHLVVCKVGTGFSPMKLFIHPSDGINVYTSAHDLCLASRVQLIHSRLGRLEYTHSSQTKLRRTFFQFSPSKQKHYEIIRYCCEIQELQMRQSIGLDTVHVDRRSEQLSGRSWGLAYSGEYSPLSNSVCAQQQYW